jgi:broad specificity phosphatase PhoE
MARLNRAAALTALCLACALNAGAQQAIIVVRHAERVDQSKDSPLSEAGRTRARALAALLVRSGVTAIYATQYQRTIATAQPLADALGLPVQQWPSDDTPRLVDRLKTRHANDVVAVVGHSDTVPDILARYGAAAVTIAADDFGNVFIVVPKGTGAPTVLRLRY